MVHVWSEEVGLLLFTVPMSMINTFLSFQSTGWSSLFFAAEVGDVATTNLLLKAGANALLKDKVSSIQSSVWCFAVLYCMRHFL